MSTFFGSAIGTAWQVILGVIGVDLPMDIRDTVYNFTNWEWTWQHVIQTLLDGISFFPIIGGLVKGIEEVVSIIKKAIELKHIDRIMGVGTEGATKLVNDLQGASTEGVTKLVNNADNVPIDELADVGTDATTTLVNNADNLVDAGKIKNFKGIDVQQNNSLFDPSFVDSKGRTNIERMNKGLAPVGVDGKSVNLHHVDQTMDGGVMEINATQHQKESGSLHKNTGQEASQINRPEFDGWRNDYWKSRANDFE